MTFYSEMAAVADELLAEFGRLVTIRINTPGSYDPETGATSVTTSDVQGYGCAFDYGANAIDGTMIVQGDKQLLLSPVGMTEPGIDDIAIIDSITWRIVNVKTVSPAGVPVLYDCNIRK